MDRARQAAQATQSVRACINALGPRWDLSLNVGRNAQVILHTPTGLFFEIPAVVGEAWIYDEAQWRKIASAVHDAVRFGGRGHHAVRFDPESGVAFCLPCESCERSRAQLCGVDD